MNEQDVNNEYDSWLSSISKFIISRSSRLISSDTQKDGRVLLLLSALSSLLYVGIVNFEEYSSLGIKLKFKDGVTFIPVIIELVCLYFAISFIIDAYSEIKIWQFKTLVKGSDDEDPLKVLARVSKEISKKGQEISSKYEDLIEKATIELGLDTQAEALPETKDINVLREYSTAMDERIEKQEKLQTILDVYYAAQDVEIKILDVERGILDFKIKSYSSEIPAVVRVYKFKHFINIIFPLLSFLVSIAALVFYLIKHHH